MTFDFTSFVGHQHWNGRKLALATKGYFQGIQLHGNHVYLCSNDGITRDGKLLAKLPNEELYGVGVGSAGVFALGGAQVYRLDGNQLVDDGLASSRLMVRSAEYSTAIASDGAQVVIGSATKPFRNASGVWKPL